MNHRIRVLGIAPYEGMKTLMSSVVADYPQIDLYTVCRRHGAGPGNRPE